MSSRPRKRRKNNPSDGLIEAELLSEGFHGRPSKEVIDIVEKTHYDKDLAQLALLCEFEILVDDSNMVTPINFKYKGLSDPIRLCGTKDREQLLLIGGDQDLSKCFKEFGIPDSWLKKRVICIGNIHSISYYSDKWHLQDGDGFSEYRHEFGEMGGDMPQLIYYPIDRRMEISGGSYEIRDEGIYN